jgi:DNA-binding MarR family transcriptional regulator/GNAT superfamily N-acetyltransferase
MSSDSIAEIRAFNRFYTRQLGLLDEHLKESPFSLSESRLLYETAVRGRTSAAELSRVMGVDPAYLSRLVFKLVEAGLIAASPSSRDRRQNEIALTREGDAAFASIDAASDAAVADLLEPIDPMRRDTLIAAMATIRAVLGDTMPAAPIVIRPHRIGELGWLVHRQGLLYNQQFGWNGEFEALIAGIYRDFELAPALPPKALWIAERRGTVIGSVFVMPSEGGEGTAQLRMLYVEPEARGLGVGRLLVDQCIAFARENGYCRVRLWTQSVLASARRIYAAAGFELVETNRHHSFGHDLEGEVWELELSGAQ